MRRSGIHRTRPRIRRCGFALVDVIIAGVILGIGLTMLFTLTSRSLDLQRQGEVEVMAAAMMDNILSIVLLEGPADYPDLHPTSGRGEFPYEQFEFRVDIDDPGEGEPYSIAVEVTHLTGRSYRCETLIAAKLGEEPDPVRYPEEPIDREARYEEIYGF